ncbi:MAG: hypothetical protein BWY79_01972 [Actinobacteria bacterium ADurb.Bin444]|nr:MAG: hypothetical protein BWY79_01972 [Actinobacteria bacterium ADurb.Bin444]
MRDRPALLGETKIIHGHEGEGGHEAHGGMLVKTGQRGKQGPQEQIGLIFPFDKADPIKEGGGEEEQNPALDQVRVAVMKYRGEKDKQQCRASRSPYTAEEPGEPVEVPRSTEGEEDLHGPADPFVQSEKDIERGEDQLGQGLIAEEGLQIAESLGQRGLKQERGIRHRHPRLHRRQPPSAPRDARLPHHGAGGLPLLRPPLGRGGPRDRRRPVRTGSAYCSDGWGALE